MEIITSRQNPLCTHLRKLAASASYRRQRGEFLCDSPKLLKEALLWGAEVRTVVATAGVDLPELPLGVRQVEVPAEVMKSLSPMETPQGTLFTCAIHAEPLPETLAGRRYVVLDTLQDVEPLGPRQLARALVVAPCTGTTLARLAAGLSDTPVTLAAKSLLRVGCPVLLAVSTNDGLGASGENIARLMQRKHYYFVPYGQDDAAQKPQSLKADLTLLPAALEAALHGQQLQPVLREWN